MKLPSEHTNITLDDLLGLVETAIHSIERLQTENAFLARQLHESENAASKATARAEHLATRIEELENTQSALKTEAEWRVWFRKKYGKSTFFTHIEKEYEEEHPGAEQVDSDVIHEQVRPGKDEAHKLPEYSQGA